MHAKWCPVHTEAIVGQLVLDPAPNEHTSRNRDLASCLRVSKSLHHVTLRALYSHVSFQHSYSFSKFLAHVTEHRELGPLVRRLDLSHLNSLGMGRTKQLNSEIQNLTASTLLRCLKLAPGLQEVLMQQHLDGDVDQAVLKKALYGLPRLRALDLCGSSTEFFVEAFRDALANLRRAPSLTLSLQNLSLHECSTIPSAELELLLSRLPQLQILDLHHTRITDAGLAAIPPTARLTHLNLGRCTGLHGGATVNFLTVHPAAASGSLVYLNLASNPVLHRLFLRAHLTELLPALPASLRSLNLSGAPVTASDLPRLVPLARHLEELSLGFADLSMADLTSLLQPSPSRQADTDTSVDDDDDDDAADETSTPHTLRYLDLTGIKSVSQPSLFGAAPSLLGASARPLEVVELADHVVAGLKKATGASKRLGWGVRECGRRAWYVRAKGQGAASEDDGARAWKMGGKSWGMRKVPVAWGEVSGLYGAYMFNR